MKTLEQFLAEYLDDYLGAILDAAIVARSGAELSVYLRQAALKARQRLRAYYEALTPAPDGKGLAGPHKSLTTQGVRT